MPAPKDFWAGTPMIARRDQHEKDTVFPSLNNAHCPIFGDDRLPEGCSGRLKPRMVHGPEIRSGPSWQPCWVRSIFGQNDSLMMKPFNDAAQSQPYTLRKTLTPVHGIDSSWNQTRLLSPQADANGLINGRPAELYDSWGPALGNF